MIKNHCWLPWDSKKEIVLREVRKPIPMFATIIDKFAMTSGVEFGFDCQKQDWVAPHGNGEVADFVIRFSPNEDSEFDGACHLTFLPLDEAGGFIRKKKIHESAFCSEFDAPINGYQQLVFIKDRYYSVYEKNPNDLLEEDYVIFKSRIQRDENGEEIGANYGKIYGPLSYKYSKESNCGMCSFVYYFNPTPNDRNLEFDTDMDKNLFGKGNWVMPHPRKP